MHRTVDIEERTDTENIPDGWCGAIECAASTGISNQTASRNAGVPSELSMEEDPGRISMAVNTLRCALISGRDTSNCAKT